ncbi:hypothetical protein EJ03DRAFT_221024 [Teratosphaeria nubilosa]|uniref:Uncharacterized protein n=1 Tax=Teratosphaeria nubilosa TaxID=161662 RepID=A0A6G1KXW2_9PEZI|nr:hypothetical protein EJ03DRAFT_221024 [Teratosphaeria nubilosa]
MRSARQSRAGTLTNFKTIPKETIRHEGCDLQVDIPYKGKIGKGTFIMLISLPSKSACECGCSTGTTCLVMVAMLWFKSAGATAEHAKRVGRVEAHIVNKSNLGTFSKELLKGKLDEACYDSELKILLRCLFRPTGLLRHTFRNHALLKVQNMLVIDLLCIEPEYRGAEFGKLALRCFEHYAKKAAQFELGKFSGTVLLSPAMLDTESYTGKDQWEIEKEIVEFYRRCGYWLLKLRDWNDTRGNCQGGINVAGRRI